MTARNEKIRFCQNNFAALTGLSVDYSSQLTAFPASNAYSVKFRSKVWKPSGCFVITASSNDKLYINDGSNKEITLTAGEYTTPALLASHIQTQLNASSANWTVSYSTTAYKFTISNTSSYTLRFSQTSAAVWDDIGYTGSSDVTATSWLADEQRNHTSEWIRFDLGYNANIKALFIIGALDDVFTISESATITLKANNIDFWDSPPYSQSLTRLDGGIFQFLDDTSDTDTGYRYWKIEIIDRTNPLGPEGLVFGHIYLGDYITLTSRNIQRGFTKTLYDPSIITESEEGALYFDEKSKYEKFDNMQMIHLDKDDRDTLNKMFRDLGKHTPFYLSIDPTGAFSNYLDELTKYVHFNSSPSFKHVNAGRFIMNMSFREVL